MISQSEKDSLLDQALDNQIAADALDEELSSLIATASRVHASLAEIPPPPHGLKPGRSAFLTAAAQLSEKRSRKSLIPFFPPLQRLSRAFGWAMPLGVVAVMAIIISTLVFSAQMTGQPVLPGYNNQETMAAPTFMPNIRPENGQSSSKETTEKRNSSEKQKLAPQSSVTPDETLTVTKEWKSHNKGDRPSNNGQNNKEDEKSPIAVPQDATPSVQAGTTTPSSAVVLTITPNTTPPARGTRPAIKPTPAISVTSTITPTITPPYPRSSRPPRQPKKH